MLLMRQVRKARKLILKDCEAGTGISTRAWQKYEQGIIEPNLRKLDIIATFLDVTVDQLMGRATLPAELQEESDHAAA